MSLARLLAGLLLSLACAGPALADLPVIKFEGRAYVELVRVAEALRAGIELSAARTQVYLRKDKSEVTLTRDWARVTVDGRTVVLDAPVRVRQDVWLVPQSFLTQVLPRLDGGAPAPSARVTFVPVDPRPAAAPAPRAGAPPAPKPAPPAAAKGGPPAKPPPAPPPARAETSAKPAPAPVVANAARAPGPAPALPPARPRPSPQAATSPPAAPPTAPATPPAAVPRPAPGKPDPAPPPAPKATPAPAPQPAGKLEDLRFRSYPSFTRIVIETSAPVEHRVESAGPTEARIRLARLATPARVEEIGDGFITQARLDPAGGDMVLRVAFEGAAGELRLSTLADPDRLVLDFGRPAEPPADVAGAVTPLGVIVLDAGHGGHDTGAVGPGGLMEKELVLDITRRVARLLEDKLDVKVLLTRDSDVFVPLRDRTSFANRERADLFVSIHANAHREAASEGVETYFLSSEATDSAARQVAAQENDAVQLEKPAARARAEVVRTILWDLAQSEYQHESSRLAEVVQDSVTRALRIPNRGVKQAGFYVLGGAAMPAVLIEVGFVTNPKEARRLRNARYRDEIAQAIFAGLAEYKRKWDARSRSALDRPR